MTRTGARLNSSRSGKPRRPPGLAERFFGLLLLLAAAAGPGPAAAADEPAAVLQSLWARNPVVARVNDRDVHWRDVMTSAGSIEITREDEARALFPVLLEQLIDRELLAAAARRAGLSQDDAVRSDVRRYEDGILSRLYLERALAQATTPERLWERYLNHVDEAGAGFQIHARHILVDTREEAQALIAALDRGAVFTELAARHSIGPSAARGGDLGYFDPARMVAPFSQAALMLSPGRYSETPVETPFGWHVIQLVDLRQDGGRPFAELVPALQSQAEAEVRQEVMRRLRANSRIEILTGQLPAP